MQREKRKSDKVGSKISKYYPIGVSEVLESLPRRQHYLYVSKQEL